LKNYYYILDVAPTADLAEITSAYHARVLQFHLEGNPEPDAAARFMEVEEAWHVLSDEWRRKAYDDSLYHRPVTGYNDVASNEKQKHSRPAGTPPHADPYARQEDVFDEHADPVYDTTGRHKGSGWSRLILLPVFFVLLMIWIWTAKPEAHSGRIVTTDTHRPGQRLLTEDDTIYTRPVSDTVTK
jgi:curved DNA-binding protein CbpA